MSNQNQKPNQSKGIIIVVAIIVIMLVVALVLISKKKDDGTATAPGNEVTEAKVEMNADFSSSLLIMDKTAIADTREDVVEALGEPESENEKEERIPELKATELVYDGGATKIIIRSGRVEQIESTSKERTFTRGVKVGMTEKELTSAMPAGSRIQNGSVPQDSIVYSEVNSTEYKYAKYARFIMNNGKIEKVILSIGD